jgi:hypothetical protein
MLAFLSSDSFGYKPDAHLSFLIFLPGAAGGKALSARSSPICVVLSLDGLVRVTGH